MSELITCSSYCRIPFLSVQWAGELGGAGSLHATAQHQSQHLLLEAVEQEFWVYWCGGLIGREGKASGRSVVGSLVVYRFCAHVCTHGCGAATV